MSSTATRRTYDAEFFWTRDLIARFTYKPGWTFSVRPGVGDWVELVMEAHVLDSREWPSPVSHITISAVVTFPGGFLARRDERHFWTFVHDGIEKMERHEIDEWFRVNGELIHDPHAPKTELERSRTP